MGIDIEKLRATTPDSNGAPEDAPIMRFFDHQHLPDRLQVVSAPFFDLAWELTRNLPPSAERTAGMRKLLEAKDCFVRAAL